MVVNVKTKVRNFLLETLLVEQNNFLIMRFRKQFSILLDVIAKLV